MARDFRHQSRLSAALLLAAVVLGGCASVDPLPPTPPDEAGVSSDLRFFLRDLEDTTLGFDRSMVPDSFLLLDVHENTWIMDILRSRDLLDTRLASRTEYLLIASHAGGPVNIWVGGRFPRFWTGIILSARGWRRSEFGRWHHTAGTEVQLARRGLLRITMAEPVLDPLTRGGDGDDGLSGDAPGSGVPDALSIAGVLGRASDGADGILYVRRPRFSGLPVQELGRLNPETIILSLREREILDMLLAMQGDREARVMVVTLRLASRSILSALELSAGDRFAIERDGTVVRVRDVVMRERALRRLLDAVMEEAEAQ